LLEGGDVAVAGLVAVGGKADSVLVGVGDISRAVLQLRDAVVVALLHHIGVVVGACLLLPRFADGMGVARDE